MVKHWKRWMLMNMSTYMLRINICLESYLDYEKEDFSRRRYHTYEKSRVRQPLTSNRWFLIIHLEKSLQVLFRSPIVICLLLLHFGYHVISFDNMLPNPEKPWGWSIIHYRTHAIFMTLGNSLNAMLMLHHIRRSIFGCQF